MFSRDVLRIDPRVVAERIEAGIRDEVLAELRRRGAVVGISGGIDSSVVAILCARALGPDRVLGLAMPERDSSPDSLRLARALADHTGIRYLEEGVSDALEALGCYDRQLEAIREVFPAFGEGWSCRLVMPSLLDGDRLNVPRLEVADPAGVRSSSRMPPAAYLQLVAATNFKQRIRMTMVYYHADRLQFAVAGTANLLEHDQGFFVRQGDGAVDVKPIAHLYKTQVYELAEYLGVPAEIRERAPTTDTFSLAQTQAEFFFTLPHREMDLCLWALDHGVPAEEAAPVVGLTTEQVARVYRDIEAKRRVSRYLHHVPQPMGRP